MSRANAFIFDLDGTLIDSLDDIAHALNRALHAVGRPPAPRERVREWIGDGLPMLCRRAWPDASASDLAALVASSAALYRAHCLDQTRPYPKILQILELLRDAGAPLAVLSNKPHEFTARILDGLDMTRYFTAVQGYVREEDKKPNPALALQLAATLDRHPRNVCLVGDSDIDIQTARRGGMIAVAVAWGFRKKIDLTRAGPDVLVDDPDELVALKNFSGED